jgi:hypothetical protein
MYETFARASVVRIPPVRVRLAEKGQVDLESHALVLEAEGFVSGSDMILASKSVRRSEESECVSQKE